MDIPESVQKVEIISLELRGDKEKGKVYNWDLSKGNYIEMPIFYRKGGIHPEGHFHTGEDPSADPQTVLIISGRMKFFLKYLDKSEKELILKDGELIKIPKFVFHEYETLEDCIYAEPRATKFATKSDRLDLETFKKLQDQFTEK